MNIYIVLILLLAAFLMYSAYYTAQVSATQCPEKIVYKYIPRSYAEELQEPVPIHEIYAQMFESPDGELAKYRGDLILTPDDTNFYTSLVPLTDSAFGRSMSV